MNTFAEMANEYMKKLTKEQDKYVLQNLSFENLIELHNMVDAEIEKRTKVKWEKAKTFNIGELKITEKEEK